MVSTAIKAEISARFATRSNVVQVGRFDERVRRMLSVISAS
jgi:hypothetical protein